MNTLAQRRGIGCGDGRVEERSAISIRVIIAEPAALKFSRSAGLDPPRAEDGSATDMSRYGCGREGAWLR